MGCLSIAVLSVLCSTVAAQVDDQSGKNLNQLTHGAIFNRVIFATQGRQCVTGSLESVGDTSVTVKLLHGPWPLMGLCGIPVSIRRHTPQQYLDPLEFGSVG